MSTSEAAEATDALRAIAECLRHLACGYGLLPAERSACLRLLEAGIPGTDAAARSAAIKILRSQRRPTSRQRDRAAELSVRLAEQAETQRARALDR